MKNVIKLIIIDTASDTLLKETSFGGLPVKNIDKDFKYPKCKTCKTEMQYQGKIKTDIGLELIFMCQNDPGMCDEWDADSGGNKVVIIDSENLEFFTPDNHKAAIREIEYGSKIVEIEANDYENAIEKCEFNDRDVLGFQFGEPEWIQGDETPNCNCCNDKMRFVALLEEGSDMRTAMNFGGGTGYLFDCKARKTAKFLWQC